MLPKRREWFKVKRSLQSVVERRLLIEAGKNLNSSLDMGRISSDVEGGGVAKMVVAVVEVIGAGPAGLKRW